MQWWTSTLLTPSAVTGWWKSADFIHRSSAKVLHEEQNHSLPKDHDHHMAGLLFLKLEVVNHCCVGKDEWRRGRIQGKS